MKLRDFNKRLKEIFHKSRQLNDDEFDKFISNISLMIKDSSQMRRRKKSVLIEKKSFRDFLND